MRRVGILGGTFNPIHNGHMAIAEYVYEKVKLDKVLFIPSYIPPHKSEQNLLSAEHRWNMVKLAVKDHAHCDASAIELQRKGKSYTVDTLKALKTIYPKGTKLYFILGEDSLKSLHTWRKVEEVVMLAKFVAVRRKRTESSESQSVFEKLKKSRLPENIQHKIQKIRMVDMPIMDISSNTVRKRVAADKGVHFYLPYKVHHYILKHNLYK
jgi:nicotinate-nucleotide adenylyltransferase